MRFLESSPIFYIRSLVFILGLSLTSIPYAGAQTFSVVHNFTGGSDGGGPLNGFTSDGAGNLYGTTSSGGTINHGVVFKVNQEGTETVLYNFKDGSD